MKKLILVLLCGLFFTCSLFAKQKEVKQEEITDLLRTAHIMSGNHEEATKSYFKILKKNPNDLKTRLALADVLSWSKKYPEAIEQYNLILKQQPDSLEVLKKLATTSTWNRDFKQAKTTFSKVLEKDPNDLEANIFMGRILGWELNDKESEKYFEKALSLKQDKELTLEFGKMFLDAGNLERAKKVLKEVIQENPDNWQAKMYLADAYTYGKEFDEAVVTYKEILETVDDIEVKEKLAIVYSWTKKYDESIDLYEEVLEEKEDPETELQFARVLGWGQRYNRALDQYEKMLDKKEDPLVELEYLGKKRYWDNRIKRAIKTYTELIEKAPENVEVMFDLSQVYSYRQMWEEAEEEYRRILSVTPNHFRASTSLSKLYILTEKTPLRVGYEFFDAESNDRVVDIHRNSLLTEATIALDQYIEIDLGYTYTEREFEDFADVIENEGFIQVNLYEQPHFWANAYYNFFEYNRNIPTEHNFGAKVGVNLLDIGMAHLSMDRRRLENSSEVIRRNFHKDDYRLHLYFDVKRRFKLGGYLEFSNYTGSNYKEEVGLEAKYLFSLDPKRLSLEYYGFWRDFRRSVDEYFSPHNYLWNSLKINWRHFVQKEEIYLGADDQFYDLFYQISIDSLGIVNQKVSGKIHWDFNPKTNFNVNAFYSKSSEDIYEEVGVKALLRHYF